LFTASLNDQKLYDTRKHFREDNNRNIREIHWQFFPYLLLSQWHRRPL